MKARLKSLRHRWILWVRGECEVEGCTEPQRGFPMYGGFCGHHFDQYMQELRERIAAEKFEREVQIHAEALRRVLPEISAPTDTQGGQG